MCALSDDGEHQTMSHLPHKQLSSHSTLFGKYPFRSLHDHGFQSIWNPDLWPIGYREDGTTPRLSFALWGSTNKQRNWNWSVAYTALALVIQFCTYSHYEFHFLVVIPIVLVSYNIKWKYQCLWSQAFISLISILLVFPRIVYSYCYLLKDLWILW